AGLDDDEAAALAGHWVRTGDFLLHDHAQATADFVVGNPPYIRLENVSRATMDAYRRSCPTMRGRADIYVGFIERGLELLRPNGCLGFICADRWMHNQYGADLRRLVSESFSVETVIAMHDVDAFDSPVSAYPAIVTLRNRPPSATAVVDANRRFGEADTAELSGWRDRSSLPNIATPAFEASRIAHWFGGGDLWPAGSPPQLAVVADLEARFPPLEDARTQTRIGIGVATGCDAAYITKDAGLVEGERLLPLLQAGDVASGGVRWSGSFLVNPWDGRGLVDLEDYPRLKQHFEAHASRLRSRHVARKRPAHWYRTIDRVDPALLGKPKIVLPDLKASAHPVLDEGQFYPHHNLYYVVSETWDLEVLGGLLLSGIANLFVGAYCVKMRGGCYRFQAQYLRRIRVPAPSSIPPSCATALAQAFAQRDVEAATAAALQAYGVKELPRVP
ncbi:MAG: Eco57I restriction-modification methylase domain-containing protein, partial [Actinomycetota bacterium]